MTCLGRQLAESFNGMENNMVLLVLGLVLFFGIHSISIVARDWRSSMVNRLGENGWKGIYSLVSIAGFALLIFGYGQARLDPIILYSPPTWASHITALLMLLAIPILVAYLIPCNIKNKLKNPMLIAVKTWATAHLVANGTLADVLLFGSFLIYAIVDMISVKKRGQAAAAVSYPIWRDILVVVVGLGVYMALVMGLHAYLFGVSPILMRA